jgi:hypothetical protein
VRSQERFCRQMVQELRKRTKSPGARIACGQDPGGNTYD